MFPVVFSPDLLRGAFRGTLADTSDCRHTASRVPDGRAAVTVRAWKCPRGPHALRSVFFFIFSV